VKLDKKMVSFVVATAVLRLKIKRASESTNRQTCVAYKYFLV